MLVPPFRQAPTTALAQMDRSGYSWRNATARGAPPMKRTTNARSPSSVPLTPPSRMRCTMPCIGRSSICVRTFAGETARRSYSGLWTGRKRSATLQSRTRWCSLSTDGLRTSPVRGTGYTAGSVIWLIRSRSCLPNAAGQFCRGLGKGCGELGIVEQDSQGRRAWGSDAAQSGEQRAALSLIHFKVMQHFNTHNTATGPPTVHDTCLFHPPQACHDSLLAPVCHRP